MEKATEFETIMNKFKKLLNLKNDTAIAEKLGINRASYSERKQRNRIPYENLINICKKEKININKLLEIEENTEKNIENTENFKNKLNESIKKLNEKESAYFYFMIETKLAEKEI